MTRGGLPSGPVDATLHSSRPDASSGLRSAIVLMLLVCAAYGNSLYGPFVLDDVPQIVENQRIHSLWPPGPLLMGSERPIAELSLALNYAIGGVNVLGYHLVNVGIHLVNALLLFGIVRRALRSERFAERYGDSADKLALVIAGLWVVHPLQTQGITYIVQRHESLMSCFYLATLYATARYAGSGARALAWAIFAFVVSALGMATKQVMVTAPLVCLLFDRCIFAGSFRAALQKRLPLYVGLCVSWAALFLAMGGNLWDAEEAGFIGRDPLSPIEYLLTQTGILLHYLGLCVWPATLVFDYGWPVADGLVERVVPTLIVSSLGAWSVWALWKRPGAGLLGATFFLILAPTSSFMPIADLAFEHRMYLPSAAVIALLVLAVQRAVQARVPNATKLLSVLALLALAGLTVRTSRRNCDYHSAVSLWQTVVRDAPENPRGYINLGIAYAQEARDPAAAREILEEALLMNPGNVRVLVNLAGALMAQGEHQAAIVHLRKVLGVEPDNAEVLANLGMALGASGDARGAIRQLERALELAPGLRGAWNNLGVMHLQEGQLESAVRAFERAVELDAHAKEARANLERARKRLLRRQARGESKPADG